MWIKVEDSLINLNSVNYISFEKKINVFIANVSFQNGEILEFSNPDPTELLKLFEGIKYENSTEESTDQR